jgi:hypothetical protein
VISRLNTVIIRAARDKQVIISRPRLLSAADYRAGASYNAQVAAGPTSSHVSDIVNRRSDGTGIKGEWNNKKWFNPKFDGKS